MKDDFEFTRSESDDGNLGQLISLLWLHKYLIVAVTLFFAACGFLFSQTIEPTYRSDSLVQMEGNGSAIPLSSEMTDFFGSESEAITEIEILKSRMVLKEVVIANQLNFIAEPRRMPGVGYFLTQFALPLPQWEWFAPYARMGESISADLVQSPENNSIVEFRLVKKSSDTFEVQSSDGSMVTGSVGTPFYDEVSQVEFLVNELNGDEGREFVIRLEPILAAISKLRAGLSVSETPRRSGLIKVTMVSHDPVLSKQILDGLMSAYVAQNIGRNAAEATRSFDFLKSQLPEVKKELALAESELNNYRLQSDSIDINLETASYLDQIVALDSQLSELSLQETQLARLYTPNHPEYAALLKMKQQLRVNREKIGDSIKSLPARQQEVLRKNRDVEVSQQIYLQLLNKSQELDIIKAGTVGNVRLIDAAAVMPGRINPKPLFNTVLWALLGGAVTCALLLVRGALSRQIDSPIDLEKLGVPVFATIPSSLGQQRLNRSRSRDADILAKTHPTELSVEALRNLRTSLHFGMLDKQRGVVAISGPSPEVGKSFVTLNLGYLAAQAGARVLVIDADLRRGVLGKQFAIDRRAKGLSDVLSGTCSYQEAMHSVAVETIASVETVKASNVSSISSSIKSRALAASMDSTVNLFAVGDGATAIEFPEHLTYDLDEEPEAKGPKKRSAGLTVIPRGKAPPNPSELLMHTRFADFIGEVSKEYDLVLLDTPPVLAATDALITSKYADMVLMVVRHGKTRLGEFEQVQKMFQQNQSDITGVVLNDYDPRNNRYGTYGETYGYQYEYK